MLTICPTTTVVRPDAEAGFPVDNDMVILHGSIDHISRSPTLNTFRNHPRLSGSGVIVFIDEQQWFFLVDIPKRDHEDCFPPLGVRCNVDTDTSSALFPWLPLQGDIVFFQGFLTGQCQPFSDSDVPCLLIHLEDFHPQTDGLH